MEFVFACKAVIRGFCSSWFKGFNVYLKLFVFVYFPLFSVSSVYFFYLRRNLEGRGAAASAAGIDRTRGS